MFTVPVSLAVQLYTVPECVC